MTNDHPPPVSVIIPVFNRPAELKRCLEALNRQSCGSADFEVVVVDNGSTAPIREIVERFSFARYGHEPSPGSYAARNRGIELARGGILAFTDSDCLPEPDWVAAGRRAVEALDGPGMVGGSVELTFPDPDNLTAAELYEKLRSFRQDTYVEDGWALTANMWTTRETIERIGGFDGTLTSGGDVEWGRRVRDAGLPQAYAADTRVLHGARRTLRSLLGRLARAAGAQQTVAHREGEGLGPLCLLALRLAVNVRRPVMNLRDPRLFGVRDRLRFAATAELVLLVRTLERFRVHFGGQPRRS